MALDRKVNQGEVSLAIRLQWPPLPRGGRASTRGWFPQDRRKIDGHSICRPIHAHTEKWTLASYPSLPHRRLSTVYNLIILFQLSVSCPVPVISLTTGIEIPEGGEEGCTCSYAILQLPPSPLPTSYPSPPPCLCQS